MRSLPLIVDRGRAGVRDQLGKNRLFPLWSVNSNSKLTLIFLCPPTPHDKCRLFVLRPCKGLSTSDCIRIYGSFRRVKVLKCLSDNQGFGGRRHWDTVWRKDRKSTRLNSSH